MGMRFRMGGDCGPRGFGFPDAICSPWARAGAAGAAAGAMAGTPTGAAAAAAGAGAAGAGCSNRASFASSC